MTVHHVHTWGTVIVLDIRDPQVDPELLARACAAVTQELERIDAWFSTYRDDSVVTAIRRAQVSPGDEPAPVRQVIDACYELTRLTGGAFDPWCGGSARDPGLFDPSGYVKGWGADRAADILLDHGLSHVSVNAAGDVSCRGEAEPGLGGWRIGIADPRDRLQVITSVLVTDAHVATSARYERGDHHWDPSSGEPAASMDSASVLATDGGVADALSTALMVTGPAGLARLPEGVSAYLISDGAVWTAGSAFTPPGGTPRP